MKRFFALALAGILFCAFALSVLAVKETSRMIIGDNTSWEALYFEKIEEFWQERISSRIDVALIDLNFDGIPELHLAAGKDNGPEYIYAIENGAVVEFRCPERSEYVKFLPEHHAAYRNKKSGIIHWMKYGNGGVHYVPALKGYVNHSEVFNLEEYHFDFETHQITCEILFERTYDDEADDSSSLVFRIHGKRVTERELKEAVQTWERDYRIIPELVTYHSWKSWAEEWGLGTLKEWFHEIATLYQPTSKYQPEDLAIESAIISKAVFPWKVVGLGGAIFFLTASSVIFFLVKRKTAFTLITNETEASP